LDDERKCSTRRKNPKAPRKKEKERVAEELSLVDRPTRFVPAALF
jgi:hypothetical protein